MGIFRPHHQCDPFKLSLQNVSPLLPLSIVSVTVALKLGIGAGLVDSAATLLNLSEGSAPVIVTRVVTTNPVTKRSSVYFEEEMRLVDYMSCFPQACTQMNEVTYSGCWGDGTCSRSSRSTARSTVRCWLERWLRPRRRSSSWRFLCTAGLLNSQSPLYHPHGRAESPSKLYKLWRGINDTVHGDSGLWRKDGMDINVKKSNGKK